ncbi:MAG: ABC transporter ATP-binding protein [Lachnospiraceae bacterium]|jgi:ABC-2 type transport system ATP-binding protein|nr:ABC transporter ATP-binding protein [Lachnospiraceae bacterium]
MIEIKNLCKSYNGVIALNNVTMDINDDDIFGLIGTNGAGKSTLLRILSGVIKQDSGEIIVDGESVFENPSAKEKLCFISDSDMFPQNSTPYSMSEIWSAVYKDFNQERFDFMSHKLGMGKNSNIRNFSKGMKRQLKLILALSSGAKYILCDEAFDGLDPVIRQTVKSIMAEEVYDRKIVPVIASHNLREIEDISGRIGLLHKGNVLLSEQLDEIKFQSQKFQVVLQDVSQEATISSLIHPISIDRSGSLFTVIARGQRDGIKKAVISLDPVFFEFLPLTLEEIFITETEAYGYDLRKIFV